MILLTFDTREKLKTPKVSLNGVFCILDVKRLKYLSMCDCNRKTQTCVACHLQGHTEHYSGTNFPLDLFGTPNSRTKGSLEPLLKVSTENPDKDNVISQKSINLPPSIKTDVIIILGHVTLLCKS